MQRLRKMIQRDSTPSGRPSPLHSPSPSTQKKETSYDVFTSIYADDSVQLQAELRDLNSILLKNKRVKEISEVKPQILANIKCREERLEGKASDALAPEDITMLKTRYGYQDAGTPQSPSKFVRRDPVYPKPRRTGYADPVSTGRPNPRSSGPHLVSTLPNTPNATGKWQPAGRVHPAPETTKGAGAIRYPNPRHNLSVDTSMRAPRTTYGKMYTPLRAAPAVSSTLFVDSTHRETGRRASTTGRVSKRPRMIARKMAKLERAMNESGDESRLRQPPQTKRGLLLEEYRQQRFRRTSNILGEIDTTDPRIVRALYQYKLKSILNFEEEGYQIKDHLQEMLRDPRRPVAKIEKQKRMQKRMALFFHRRYKSKGL